MQSTEIRQAIDPRHAKGFDTRALRSEFLIEDLFTPGAVKVVYSHLDRLILAGAVPQASPMVIDKIAATGTESWLERREATIVNIGARAGQVSVGGTTHNLSRCDMLYIGMGAGPVTVSGEGAKFYILSCPAHRKCPTRLVTLADATEIPLGTPESSNQRVIHQFIHPAVVESCQLVVGMTQLKTGSVWNTMPSHVHDRRSEAYLYIDLPEDQRVFHLMGEPEETRHLVVANEQAILSPGWSIHSGAGTSSYSFIWCMAGDNMDFTDMDMVAMEVLR